MPAFETLAEEAGVARSYAVVAPDGRRAPLWKVLVDVGLGQDGHYPLAYVGAYDIRRRAALERGAGEAVERFALAAGGTADARGLPDDLRAAGFDDLWWWPRESVAPERRPEDVSWYRARRLGGPGAVLVPAPLIDDDGGARHRAARTASFDPSPSGTAAALSEDSATRAALLEIIERDAVLCAWATGVGVRRGEPRQDDGILRRLCVEADRLGLHPFFGVIPTAVPGLEVVCCAIVDRTQTGRLVAFGSKASASGGRAGRGAVQEALQIHELLTNLSTNERRPAEFDAPTPMLVRDDVARAWWWTTASGADSMEAWIDGWGAARPLSDDAPEEPELAVLVEHVLRDGGDPLRVDLTPRLPEAIRGLGWHVVKIVCPGYQPLRLDETVAGTWDRSRLAAWCRRHGSGGDGFGADAPPLPHPLI